MKDARPLLLLLLEPRLRERERWESLEEILGAMYRKKLGIVMRQEQAIAHVISARLLGERGQRCVLHIYTARVERSRFEKGGLRPKCHREKVINFIWVARSCNAGCKMEDTGYAAAE